MRLSVVLSVGDKVFLARALALGVVFAFVAGCAGVQSLAPLSLTGHQVQGGLLLGTTAPDTKAWLDNKPLEIDENGTFVIALGRSAPRSIRLRLERPGGVSGLRRIAVLPIEQREWKIQRITGVPSKKVNISDADYQRILAERKKMKTELAQASVKTKADAYVASQVMHQDGELILSEEGKQAFPDLDFHTVFEKGFLQPVEGPITGVFGSQRFFNGQPRKPHYGLDIAAPTGTPVMAPADGVVHFAHPDMFFNGKMLVLFHGDGVFTSYSHLSAINVEPGQTVKRGEKIAEIGATGRVTGPHLHWEVRHHSTKVDPQLLLVSEEGLPLYE